MDPKQRCSKGTTLSDCSSRPGVNVYIQSNSIIIIYFTASL